MIPHVLDNALGFNVYRVGLLFRRELMRALSDYKLTAEQWQVMATLWATDRPLKQSEIVHLTLRDKPSVSRIVQRLERDGWIEKQDDPQDGRVTIILPTPKGIALKEQVPDKLYSHFQEVLKDFGKDDQKTLMMLLKKIRYILGDPPTDAPSD